MIIDAALPPHLQQFVREKLASGEFRSETELVHTALHLLEEQSHSSEEFTAWLKHEIDKGMESKPSEPVSHKYWEQLRGRFRSGAMNEQKAFAERTHARLERLRAEYGTFSDSTKFIREDRDARG